MLSGLLAYFSGR